VDRRGRQRARGRGRRERVRPHRARADVGGLTARPRQPDPEAARRAEESLRAIEAGGLPPAAVERLAALKRGGPGFYTSDLTTSEFLLARQAGFRPLTQVMGSCYYAVGYQTTPFMGGYGPGLGGAGYYGMPIAAGGVFELDVQSEAWNEARRLALSRLVQEAQLAGADAVLGVEITRGVRDWAQGLIEYVAVGTAVVSERYDFGGELFCSALSVQQFSGLMRNGWMPVGIAAGSTVVYVAGGFQTAMALSAYGARYQNSELTELTSGLYQARGLAMRRVQDEARSLGATGMVGVAFEQSQTAHERDDQGGKRLDLVVTLHVLGTAIAPIAMSDEPPPTYIALTLNEER
jgi:uncharacterized protein YbjQ (UPF0145 family)